MEPTFTATVVGKRGETHSSFSNAVDEFMKLHGADKSIPPGYRVAACGIIYTAGGTNLYVDAWCLREMLDELGWVDTIGNLSTNNKEPDPVWLECQFRRYAPKCSEGTALEVSRADP